jgi:hypothetical protein
MHEQDDGATPELRLFSYLFARTMDAATPTTFLSTRCITLYMQPIQSLGSVSQWRGRKAYASVQDSTHEADGSEG